MKIQSETLKHSIFLLCLMAPWSLLWLDSSLLFPYETGKAWLFRAIVSVAFSLLLIYQLAFRAPDITDKKAVMSIRVWHYSMLAFLLWTGLTNIFGIDLYRSFWSNYERMSGYLAYIYWAAYFLCLIAVLNEQRARLLMFNLLFVILMVGLIGLLEPEERIISTLGNPIYLGNLAVFGIFISGFLIAGEKYVTRSRAIILGIIFLLVVGILLLVLFKTASRGPMLALFAGIMLMLLRLAFTLLAKKPMGVVIAVAMGAIIIASLIMIPGQQPGAWLKNSDSYALQRLGGISLHNQTTIDRLENWSIALDASEQHPLLGWGQENYAIAYHEHYRAGVMDDAKIWFDRAHNAYLDVLIASGWPGLLLYLLLLCLPLLLVVRHSPWRLFEQAFILALLGAYIVKNIAGFDTLPSSMVWISVAAVIWRSTWPINASRVSRGGRYTGIWLILAFFASVVLVYHQNLKPYQQNQLFSSVLNQPPSSRNKAMQHLLALPASTLVYAVNSKLAVYDQLLRHMADQPRSEQQAALKTQLNLRAGTLVSQELARQPRNARISYNGAMLLAHLGQYSLSIKLLTSVLNSAPQRTVFWHQLALVFEAAGQADDAQKAYAKQTSLNPQWGKK